MKAISCCNVKNLISFLVVYITRSFVGGKSNFCLVCLKLGFFCILSMKSKVGQFNLSKNRFDTVTAILTCTIVLLKNEKNHEITFLIQRHLHAPTITSNEAQWNNETCAMQRKAKKIANLPPSILKCMTSLLL